MSYKYRAMSKNGIVYGVPVGSVNGKHYMIHGATEDAANTRNEVDFYYSEIDSKTIRLFTGYVTKGKKIEVFDGDKWKLSFYSQTVHGYVTNQGTIKRDKNGMWVCCENPGVNKFELLSMIEDYEGAFEICNDAAEAPKE